MNNYDEQINDIEIGYDFDSMMNLAKNSPDEFELRRQQLINNFIAGLPEDKRHRMECLQWRIDRTREQAKTPLAACMALTEMMWESFEQLNTLFMEMRDSDNTVKLNAELPSADILPFKTA